MTPDLTSGPSKPYPVNDRTGADDEVWLSELQRIEDEPDAPESLRERVAEAMWEAVRDDTPWQRLSPRSQDRCRVAADAAITVIGGQQ